MAEETPNPHSLAEYRMTVEEAGGLEESYHQAYLLMAILLVLIAFLVIVQFIFAIYNCRNDKKHKVYPSSIVIAPIPSPKRRRKETERSSIEVTSQPSRSIKVQLDVSQSSSEKRESDRKLDESQASANLVATTPPNGNSSETAVEILYPDKSIFARSKSTSGESPKPAMADAPKELKEPLKVEGKSVKSESASIKKGAVETNLKTKTDAHSVPSVKAKEKVEPIAGDNRTTLKTAVEPAPKPETVKKQPAVKPAVTTTTTATNITGRPKRSTWV